MDRDCISIRFDAFAWYCRDCGQSGWDDDLLVLENLENGQVCCPCGSMELDLPDEIEEEVEAL